MAKRSSQVARWRVAIAFACLFIFIFAVSFGAYLIGGLSHLRENISVAESEAKAQPLTVPRTELARQNPTSKLSQLIQMVNRTADESSAAAEALSNELGITADSKNIDLKIASRGDLEALHHDLAVAQANEATFKSRYAALLKAARDKVENYARSLNFDDKKLADPYLFALDTRQGDIADLTSRMLTARSEFYRKYDEFVAVLLGEYGSYKVVNGLIIFPSQQAVDRYNVAAHAMMVSAKRLAETEQQLKRLVQSPEFDMPRP